MQHSCWFMVFAILSWSGSEQFYPFSISSRNLLHRITVSFAQVETAGTEDDGGEDSLGRALTIAVAVSGALVMQLFNFFYDFFLRFRNFLRVLQWPLIREFAIIDYRFSHTLQVALVSLAFVASVTCKGGWCSCGGGYETLSGGFKRAAAAASDAAASAAGVMSHVKLPASNPPPSSPAAYS